MKTIIYFVRHAPYQNPDRLVPGRIPGYRLDEAGIKKAKRVGEYLQKNSKAKYIYTSPLERAYETADIVATFLPKAKIAHAYELTEIDATQWQAYKLENLFKNHYYEEYLENPSSTQITENLDSLAKRVEDFTLSLCNKHQGEEVICVSHKDPITVLRLKLEGKPLNLLNNYRVDMASISKFTFADNCRFTDFEYKTFE